MSTTEQLWNDYNNYRFRTAQVTRLEQTRGVNPRSLKRSDHRLEALEKMGAWCGDRGIDPRHWLYSLFAARKWVFAPRFDHLISPKHLKKYPLLKRQAGGLYDRTMRAEVTATRRDSGRTYDPNRDTSPTIEALKQALAGVDDSQGCMARLRETLGYHPKSRVCAECSRAAECETQLQGRMPFDIVALRNGEISLREAQEMAAYHG